MTHFSGAHAVVRDWATHYPKKRAAGKACQKAIADGKLVRLPCGVCGTTQHVHGHHPDYDKPLDVMWLCRGHHIEWHVKHGPGLNGGESSARKWARDEIRSVHAKTGCLWSPVALDSLEHRIRMDIAAELGFEPEHVVDLSGLSCHDEDFGSCAAEPVLVVGDDETSFSEIAAYAGVSGACIGDVYARAMEKLRKRGERLVKIRPMTVTQIPSAPRAQPIPYIPFDKKKIMTVGAKFQRSRKRKAA